jgi:hypothetical protein
MSRTAIAFFELDATPHRGVPSELAERLGALTGVAGYREGALYVRPDHDAVAIQVAFDGDDRWLEGPAPMLLIEGAHWRSRSADVRTYRAVGRIAGDESPADESFFVVQRFVVQPEKVERLTTALARYIERFMVGIAGFQGAHLFASDDAQRVVAVMPWAFEAAVAALETRAGSLAAMQELFALAERHVYESFERISHMLAPHADAGQPTHRE